MSKQSPRSPSHRLFAMGSSQSRGATAASSQDLYAIKAGDRVAVTMDVENFRLFQNDYGGWEAEMTLMFGNVGTVLRVEPTGGVMVDYPVAKRTWNINPAVLEKVIVYKTGDKVRVCVSLERLKQLQEGHGGYNEAMAQCIGKVGLVITTAADADTFVRIGGHRWMFNPLCLAPAPTATVDREEAEMGGLHEAIQTLGSFEQLLRHMLDDVDVVSTTEGGQQRSLRCSPLHVACFRGNEDDIRILVRNKRNIEALDNDKNRPLHYCAHGNQPDAMKILIEAGADVNALNEKKCSPLQIAVLKGHVDCVRLLLTCSRRIDVNTRDFAGDTALHDAISKGNFEIAAMLIDFPSMDLTIKNARGFNALHEACLKGNNPVVEKILLKRPDVVNIPKEDGFTALHLAAVNGHYRITQTLLAKGRCNLELRNNKQETPLVSATLRRQWDVVELLVEAGADINSQDKDGDTPLNTALHTTIMGHILLELLMGASGPSKATNLSAIERQLEDRKLAPICYLANRGADLYRKNKNGVSPLDTANALGIADVVLTWATKPRFVADTRAAKSPQTSRGAAGVVQCKICADAEADVVFKPCGHRVTCQECCLRCKLCLVCAKPVQAKVLSDGQPVQATQANQRRQQELDTRLQELEERHQCAICMERTRNVVFLCGHGACAECSANLDCCHMCRVPVERKIPIFSG